MLPCFWLHLQPRIELVCTTVLQSVSMTSLVAGLTLAVAQMLHCAGLLMESMVPFVRVSVEL